jgi:hypothetical protein
MSQTLKTGTRVLVKVSQTETELGIIEAMVNPYLAYVRMIGRPCDTIQDLYLDVKLLTIDENDNNSHS